MNSIPLIKGNTPQEINTSIISLKKALAALEGNGNDVQNKIKQINELINGINSHLETIDGQITDLQPIDIVTSGDMRSVTSGAVASALDVPKDAVLHYSFDDLPDYPDGTAVEKYIKDFTSVPTNWSSVNYGVLTVSNGELINTVTNGTTCWIRRYYSSTVDAVIKIKIKATKECTITIAYYNATSSQYEVITALENAQAGQDYVLTGYIPHIDYVLIKAVTPTATDFQLILSEYYVGDGSYTTPIIDNANGQNNGTNNGGFAIKGVSGKGVQLLKNKSYIDGLLPWKPHEKKVFTISCWIKDWDRTSNLYLVNDWSTQNHGNLYIVVTGASSAYDALIDYPIETGIARNSINKNTIDWNSINSEGFLITGVINGANTKFYVNGVSYPIVFRENEALSDSIMNRQNFQINKLFSTTADSNKCIIDDFQVFNRALSEAEVMALYLNRANTPKYYSWADWKLN